MAAVLGLSQAELAAQIAPPPTTSYRRRKPPADIGKPYYRQHIVSIRHADNPQWPKEDEGKIAEARAKYEAGTHEMCQGREGDWFVLYCVPRRKRVGARKFFRTWE